MDGWTAGDDRLPGERELVELAAALCEQAITAARGTPATDAAWLSAQLTDVSRQLAALARAGQVAAAAYEQGRRDERAGLGAVPRQRQRRDRERLRVIKGGLGAGSAAAVIRAVIRTLHVHPVASAASAAVVLTAATATAIAAPAVLTTPARPPLMRLRAPVRAGSGTASPLRPQSGPASALRHQVPASPAAPTAPAAPSPSGAPSPAPSPSQLPASSPAPVVSASVTVSLPTCLVTVLHLCV